MTQDQEVHQALEALRTYVNNITFEGDTLALDRALSRIEKFIYYVRLPIYAEWAARRAAQARAKPFATSRADIAAVLTELKLTFKEPKP